MDFNYSVTLIPIGGTGRLREFTVNPAIGSGLGLAVDGQISGRPTHRGRNRLQAEVHDSDGVPVRKTFILRVR